MKFFITAFLLTLSIHSLAADPLHKEALALNLQSTNKPIVGGKFNNSDYILRLDSSGNKDTTFGQNWTIGGCNNQVNAVEVLSDDTIIIGGKFTTFDNSIVGYIAKLSSDGDLDTTFAFNNGTGFDDEVNSLKVLSNGKILVGGKFTDFNGTSVTNVAVLNSDGTLDTSFDPQSSFNDEVNDVEELDSTHYLMGGKFTDYQGDSYSYFINLKSNAQVETNFFGQAP